MLIVTQPSAWSTLYRLAFGGVWYDGCMTTPENRLAAGRDSGGRFAKGVTGNPGGRPKGLASYIREQTTDGQDLVDMVMHILQHPKGNAVQRQRLQLECIQWLADRGFGKAALNVEHSGLIAHDFNVFAEISTEDLRLMIDDAKARAELRAEAVIEGEMRELPDHRDSESRQ